MYFFSILIIINKFFLNISGADTNASHLYTVSQFYVHPFYNNVSLENDIAVVMVKSFINFTEEVGPVCLPFQHQFDSFAGSYVDLLGEAILSQQQLLFK